MEHRSCELCLRRWDAGAPEAKGVYVIAARKVRKELGLAVKARERMPLCAECAKKYSTR